MVVSHLFDLLLSQVCTVLHFLISCSSRISLLLSLLLSAQAEPSVRGFHSNRGRSKAKISQLRPSASFWIRLDTPSGQKMRSSALNIKQIRRRVSFHNQYPSQLSMFKLPTLLVKSGLLNWRHDSFNDVWEAARDLDNRQRHGD